MRILGHKVTKAKGLFINILQILTEMSYLKLGIFSTLWMNGFIWL